MADPVADARSAAETRSEIPPESDPSADMMGRAMTFAERSSAVAAPRDAPLRILVVAIGLAVLTIGVALSVFPGLAVLVVSRGLTILSPDLRWAGKLHRPMQKLHDLRKTRNSDRLLPSN